MDIKVKAGLVGLATIVVMVGGFVGFQSSKATDMLEAKWDVKDYPFAVPADAGSIKEGRRLLVARGCTECHGANLEGKAMDMGPMGSFYSPNLTTSDYTPAEAEKIVRHGIKKDGTPALLMPSEDYWIFSDKDLGAIMAAVEAAVPYEKPNVPHDIGLMAKVLLGMGEFQLAANKIDHSANRGLAPVVGPSPEYGKYLSATCIGCHGKDLKGGIQQGPPGTAPSTDLTSTMKGWSREDLKTAMTVGKRPDGSYLDPFMPKDSFVLLTETEFDALFAYLSEFPDNK